MLEEQRRKRSIPTWARLAAVVGIVVVVVVCAAAFSNKNSVVEQKNAVIEAVEDGRPPVYRCKRICARVGPKYFKRPIGKYIRACKRDCVKYKNDANRPRHCLRDCTRSCYKNGRKGKKRACRSYCVQNICKRAFTSTRKRRRCAKLCMSLKPLFKRPKYKYGEKCFEDCKKEYPLRGNPRKCNAYCRRKCPGLVKPKFRGRCPRKCAKACRPPKRKDDDEDDDEDNMMEEEPELMEDDVMDDENENEEEGFDKIFE